MPAELARNSKSLLEAVVSITLPRILISFVFASDVYVSFHTFELEPKS